VNLPEITRFHDQFLKLFNEAKGSKSKHQAWKGGYRDHLEQCLDVASLLYNNYSWNFPFESVVKVLYFHDIEKMWKYIEGLDDVGRMVEKHKSRFYQEMLPDEFGIQFNEEELNALKYIHGEGDDYCEKRVMNELAGLCHACDTISARCFYDWRSE